MTVYSISEVEKITGIKPHNLRIWEKRYQFSLPKRKDTNIRFYDEEDVKFLLQTANLLNAGYKISAIAAMSEKERKEAVLASLNKKNDFELLVNQLTVAMIDLDEELFHTICQAAIHNLGVEGMMFSVIYPFLERIGLLWITNNVNPAQEHFVSNLVRQKIIAALDKLSVPPRNSSNRYLLFLPEGELHEISLLFLNFILRSRGNHTLYLGQNTPVEDIKNAVLYYEPNCVATILTSAHKSDLDHLYSELQTLSRDTHILIAGKQAVEADSKSYPGLLFIHSPIDIIRWIETYQEQAQQKNIG